MATDVIARDPTHVFIEYAVNDAVFPGYSTERDNGWWPASEALIRRLRTALPNTRLVFVNLVMQESCGASTAAIASRDHWEALCAHYDLDSYRIDRWIEALIGEEPTGEACTTYYSGVHFQDAGHEQIYLMLRPHLTNLFPEPLASPLPLPAHLYTDVADFEHAPIIRTGTDNDGETGTGWATADTTARQSSTPDDTITWTGTLSSFAVDVARQVSAFAWSVDGGTPSTTNVTTATSNIWQLRSFERGEHTITLRVISGTVKVARFLAI